jgi:hypothetical protein
MGPTGRLRETSGIPLTRNMAAPQGEDLIAADIVTWRNNTPTFPWAVLVT